MNNTRFQRFLFAFLGCCLIFLLAACGSGGGKTVTTPTTTSNSPTPGNSTVTPPATATVLPPTQTSCPAAGTARAAVMPPLALGTHQNVVYSVNEFQGNTPTFGTLKRYDVATGQKTEIVKMPGVSISDAQVSADGQWLLFLVVDRKQAKLQLIRMDGKALQTLYCTQPSDSFWTYFSPGQVVQWSFDQRRVVFRSRVNSVDTLYLLNMQDGSLQTELSGNVPSVLTWLDNTRLYLENPGVDAPATDLYLLDTSRGAPQSVAYLQSVFHTGATVFCWDAASSTDGTHLFISQCTSDINGGSPSAYASHGPSTISIRPATGGSPQTVFTSSSLGIRAVRVISNTSLLLLVKSRGPQVDTSQNGLWRVNTDGTGLTSLSRDSAELDSSLNFNSQYPWSNVSRDGSLYSLQSELFTPPGTLSYALLVGSLHGGSPMAFASISDGTSLELVGWTTM